MVGLTGSTGFWGANHLMYLPAWMAVVLVAIALVLVWIPANAVRKLGRSIESLFGGRNAKVSAVLAVVLVLALLIAGRAENHLLGDSYQRLSMVTEGTPSSATEYLDMAAHRLAYQVVNDAYLSYLLLGLLSGILFLAAVAYFARDIASSSVETVAVAVLFLGLAQMQFFAGYAESYAIMTGFLALCLYMGWRASTDERFVWYALVSFAIASAFHLSAAFLAPAFIYLFWSLSGKTGKSLYKAVSVVILIGVIAVGAYVYTEVDGAEIFTPIVATETNPYTLLSLQHLTDLGNVLLLAAPLPLILILVLAFGNATGMGKYFRKPPILFLLVGSLCALIFSAIVDPRLGALRDWDLLSMFGVPMAFLAAQMTHDFLKEKRQYAGLFLAGSAVIVAHTIPWIYSNSEKQLTVETMKTVIHNDIHYTPEYYAGERLMSWGKILGDYYGDTAEKQRAYGLRVQGSPQDQKSWLVYGISSLELGQESEASKALTHIRDLSGLSEYQFENLARLQLQLGYIDDAKKTLVRFSERYPDSFHYYFLSGLMYQMEQNAEAAAQFYDRAMRINPRNVDLLLNYASIKANMGDLSGAERLLNMAAGLPDLSAQDRQDLSYLRRAIREGR